MPLLGPEGRDQLKTFGRVSTVGLEMALSVVVGMYGGSWLDGKLGTDPWLKWIGLGLGIGAAIRAVVRVARTVRKDMTDDQDKKRDRE